MILVDPIRRHQSGEWCHMVSDESVEELHEFAARIGLKRKSFQSARVPITICARRREDWP
jgi:uncharacterized protein DUF4031